jgi:hypothetical protein
MAAPVTLRCPRCGNYLLAVPPYPGATALTRCPHCSATLPFVAPRDPAPLYSWEVHPGLYSMGSLPKPPSRWTKPALAAILVAGVIFLAVLGGWLTWVGNEALRPGSVTVGGQIRSTQSPGLPITDAHVSIQGENGFTAHVVTDANGRFAVPRVPFGGVELDAAAAGYSPLHVELFASPVYTSVAGGMGNLGIGLAPGNASNSTSVSTTPFPTLESLVATLLSGTGLFVIGALVGAFGAWAAWRGRLPMAVAAGATLVAAPAVIPLLGLLSVTPALAELGFLPLPLGLMALLLTVPALARQEPPPEPL